MLLKKKITATFLPLRGPLQGEGSKAQRHMNQGSLAGSPFVSSALEASPGDANHLCGFQDQTLGKGL